MAGTEQKSLKQEVAKTTDDARDTRQENASLNEQFLSDVRSTTDPAKTTVERTAGEYQLAPLVIDGHANPFRPAPNLADSVAINAMDNVARLLGNRTQIGPVLDQVIPPAPVAEQIVAPVIDSIMQQAFRLGSNDYQLSTRLDGRAEKIAYNSPDGSGSIELARDANGALKVMSATGKYMPQDGKINFEGIPVRINPDGSVQGDLNFRANGDIKYVPSKGPDRVEYLRRADGTVQAVDLGTWKRTVMSPDGQVKSDYWDGYEYRNGEVQADGRIKFVPADAAKPDFMKRELGSGVDKASIQFNQGIQYDCDFRTNSRVRINPGPPEQRDTTYFNGADYVQATQTENDKPRPGDVTYTYKEPRPGEPITAVQHSDGSMTTYRQDNTVVEKDPDGYVTSITGPRGTWQFQRDVNGDIYRAQHTYADQTGNQVTQVMTRQGRELYPGMERWRSSHGLNSPGSPSDLPPRSIEDTIDYNTFVDSTGNVMRMNLNVTADGTVRMETSGGPGKTYVTYESPGQDRYRDLGSTMVSEHAGNVIETFDKATKESTFRFNRAGRDITLNSTEGKVEILTDGSVIQDKTSTGLRDYYLPNGVVASIGSDGSNPPKPVAKAVQIPGKDGALSTLKVGENGVSELKVLDDSSVLAVTKGTDGKELQTVYNPRNGSTSVKAGGDKYWRVSNAEGKYMGVSANPGQLAWTQIENGILGADGVTYDANSWAAASNLGPDGEMVLTGRNDKAGLTVRIDATGVTTESGNETQVYRYPSSNDVNSARYENGKLVSLTIKKKLYKPEASTDAAASTDQFSVLVDESGNRVALPSDAKKFDRASGRFVS